MNKHHLFTIFLLLAVLFSISAISAEDMNSTEQYDVSTTENASEILLSEYSQSLSDTDNSADETISTDNVSSTVEPADTVKSDNISKYYGESKNYVASFTDGYGNPLTDTDIEIIIDNETKTVKTDNNGTVSLKMDFLPGTYKITAINPNTSYQLTTEFKIIPTIRANDLTKVRNDDRKFSATFLESDGTVLAGQNVNFTVNGKTYTVKTDKNGVARLSISALKAGTYDIISYNADGSNKTNKIRVLSTVSTKLKTSSYKFLKKNTKQIKVTLLNSLGYGVSGKTVKIKVNGKTYSKKTNSGGNAYFKLSISKTGKYTVKYNFKGDSIYKSSSSSNKVTVILTNKKIVTIKDILKSASKVKSNYANKGTLPKTVSVGKYKFTFPEFYYLMCQATKQLSKSKTTKIYAISGVKAPSSQCSDAVYSAAVTKSKYIKIAKNSISYIKKNKRVPKYINAVAGKIAFEDYAMMNARVLDYFSKHKEAPNFVSFISTKKPNFNFEGNNPYGLMGKKVWIDADGGSNAIKLELAKALRKLGWEVHIGDTYANAHYEDYFNCHPGYVLINIYNGFCAGTIRELASDSVQSLLKTKNVVCVPVFHTAGWTAGMKPYRYGDFSGYSAKKAWDDDFSTIDPKITNVKKFLKVNDIKYCASPTCDLIVKQFLKGGYFASVS